MGILDVLPQAELIRDATAAGENTATRVGGCMCSIITEANAEIQAILTTIGDLPAEPFDRIDWQGRQEDHVGDQMVEFESNGSVVQTFLIKTAAASYSGLMSANDKIKLDALSLAAVAGSLADSASGDFLTLSLYAADGTTQLSNVTLPDVGAGFNSEATSAGILTRAQKNWADLAAGCLCVYLYNGANIVLDTLSVGQVYAGQVLKFTAFSTDTQPGTTFSVQLNDIGGAPLWSATGNAQNGASVTIDIDDLLSIQGRANSIRVGSIKFTTNNDEVILRGVLSDKSAGNGGSGISLLSANIQSAAIAIIGKDSGGNTLTSITLPAATNSAAGVMTANDKIKLAEAVIGSVAVGSLSIVQTPTTVDVGINDATQQAATINTYQIPSASTSAAGVLSASDKNKLNGIAAGAEVNTLSGLSFDATANPESAQTKAVDIVNKVGNLNEALSGGFIVDVLPTTGSLENRSMPKNGTNYHLGSISSLAFDNNMAAMTLGCTVHFTAVSSFVIVLPYVHDIGGVANTPRYGARMADSVSLSCSAGEEYELDITTICSAAGQPINVFALHNLITPDATSNGLS